MSVELYTDVVSELQANMTVLENCFVPPERTRSSDKFVFRHKNKTVVLAIFLKAVRIISLLNASLPLLREGHTQAAYILCRAIDESVEDIIFLANEPRDQDAAKRRDEFLDEFYQEEFNDPDDPLSSNPRSIVARRHIRAALGAIQVSEADPGLHSQVSKSIAQVYSGFVHGAYVFTMELFGGDPGRFHMDSMLNTPRAIECEEQFKNQIYRSILAIRLVAVKVDHAEIAGLLEQLAKEFDETMDCQGQERIELVRKRLNSLPSRRTSTREEEGK